MKIYISGAITNNPNYKEDFERAEKKLKAVGYEVINPTMVELPPSCTHADYMKVDFALLDLADGIYMLSNYENSKGACMEYRFAIDNGLEIMFENEVWKEIPGCDGNYMISNFGRVKSKKRTYKSGRSYGITRKTKKKS